jgi:hypothetical protein
MRLQRAWFLFMAKKPEESASGYDKFPRHVKQLASEIYEGLDRVPGGEELQDKLIELLSLVARDCYPQPH